MRASRNVWRQRKEEIWDAYWPHDPEIPHRNIHSYSFSRQIRPEGGIFWPGSAWVPPGDFVEGGC